VARIAFLGTGLLGAAFAEAASKRGDTVSVWNRTEAKARALEKFGVRVARSAADAVRDAERVHLVLPDDAIVEEVVAAMRPGLPTRAIVIDHTTALPALTATRAPRLNAEGVAYLHCPVFIGPAAARDAQGTIMVSGPVPLWEAVRPALERQAARVEYLGERPDLAAIYKLAGNCLILGITGLVSDVLSIAAGAGVSPTQILDATGFINPAGVIAGRGRKMAAGDFSASFELAMARKDVRLMIETAGELPLAVLNGMAERMDRLLAEGHGAEDAGVMAREAIRAMT
jgi:3-hydroxyisobutyrate dehydrogenase